VRIGGFKELMGRHSASQKQTARRRRRRDEKMKKKNPKMVPIDR
jgi:hypothetical protein